MKSKVFRRTLFLTILLSLLACSITMFSFSKNIVYASNEQTIDCYALIYNGEIENSVDPVGQIGGEGVFVVGQENVPLTASANTGYQIVGWQVTYDEYVAGDSRNQTNLFLKGSGEVDANTGIETITLKTKSGTSVEVDISYEYVNGYVEKSVFTLSYIFEDISVIPIFDYVYYNLNVNSIVELLNLENHFNIGEDVVYYSSFEDDIYSNAIIKIGDDYFYFGNLHNDSGNYYTLHESQEINYLRGAFRLSDRVELEQNINIVDDELLASDNIDVLGFSVLSSSTIELQKNSKDEALENSFKLTKEDASKTNSRTTAFSVDFYITDCDSKVNVLNIEYDELKIIKFDVYVNSVLQTNETIIQQIMSCVSVANAFCSIDDDEYFVKLSEDNIGTLTVDCAQSYLEGDYYYYNFSSLDDKSETSKQYTSVTDNFVIKVDYTAVGYYINFTFVDVTNNNFQKDESLNLINPIMLNRGEEFDSSDATKYPDLIPDCTGYNFKGLTTVEDPNTLQSSVLQTINYERPENITVFVCYEKIKYNLKIAGINSINLYDGTNYIYPLDSISLKKNGIVDAANGTVSNSSLLDPLKNEFVFTPTISLGDTITFESVVNTGFSGLKYSLVANSADYLENNQFILDKTFIDSNESNFDGVVLTIYAVETYEFYTLTYTTPLTFDGAENVIMANISAMVPANAKVEYINSDNEISTEDDVKLAQIKISELKLYDNVKLIAEGKTFNDNGDRYVYAYFTEDGKSELDNIEEEDKSKQSFSFSSIINRTFQVKVVYAIPKASLEILADSAAYTTLQVTQNGEVLEIGENGRYDIAVNTDLTVVVAELNFGYAITGYTLKVGLTELLKNSSTSLTFKLDNVDEDNIALHTLIINFEAIDYNFKIKQIGGGSDIDGTYVKFDNDGDGVKESEYVPLDVVDKVLKFEKPEGYYASSVVLLDKNLTPSVYSQMNESNALRNEINRLIFEYAFSDDEFKTLVSYESGDGANKYINIEIEYTVYSYEVYVEYDIDNKKGDYRDDEVKFPSIALNYVFGSNPSQTIEGTFKRLAGVSSITFIGVPYGSSVDLVMDNTVQTGLSIKGWFNIDSNTLTDGYETNLRKLTFKNGIKNDEEFKYFLSYETYDLSVRYNTNKGTPEVYVNGEIVDITNGCAITIFDTVEIVSNASQSKGYVFDSFLKQYSYSSETWAQKYESLYIYDASKQQIKLNDSATYLSANTYFEIVDESFVDQDALSYVDDSFKVENYVITGGDVYIFIEYITLEIQINNTSLDFNRTTLTGAGTDTQNGRIEIPLTEYASYSVEAVNLITGATRPIDWQSGATVNVNDKIIVTIQINDNAVNSFDGAVYDLRNGLTLNGIVSVANVEYTRVSNGDGNYTLTFEVRSIIEMVDPREPIIEIQYKYKVEKRALEVTTNIKASTFYSLIQININESWYGFLDGTYDLVGNSVKNEMQFLAKSRVAYQLKTLEGFFRVSSIKVYANGKEVDLSSVGVEVEYADENNSSIQYLHVRYVENILIEFQLEPVILFGGEERNSDYTFNKTFNCYADGVGIKQELSAGSGANDDIGIASDAILNAMSLTYKNMDGGIVEPINVGLYIVDISFGSAVGYEWLSEVVMPHRVYLKINPKNIYVSYDSQNIEQISRAYNGSSSISASGLLKWLIIGDGTAGGLRVSYEDSNFVFNTTNESLKCFANITTTVLGQEQVVKDANENVYYNVYIQNLNLDPNTSYNANFTLEENASIVIKEYIKIMRKVINIEGLQVYNKVYDGTKTVVFKNVENLSVAKNDKFEGDELYVDAEKIKMEFENAEVGANKKILIDASGALTGGAAGNYKIDEKFLTNGVIYPYSISTKVKDIGTITILNNRGLTDYNYVNLIPIGATLEIEPILFNSTEYTQIYRQITRHITRGNAFAIGYRLSLDVDGNKQNVNNNLYLSVPNVENITGAIYVTGQQSNKIDYSIEDGQVVIDLRQINEDINSIILTQSRTYMKWWQILIIVLSIILILIAIIIIFIIVRRRKKEKYSINEKI